VATTVTQEEQILNLCIKDIDAGAWICGDWSCEVKKGERPKGCAAGLVAIHSGNATRESWVSRGIRWIRFHVIEPWDDHTKWKGAPARVLFALSDVARHTESDGFLVSGDPEDPDDIDDATNSVIAYNDRGGLDTDTGYMKAKEAKKWFEDALTLIREKTAA